MDAAVTVARWLSNATFVLLAVTTTWMWWRRSSAQTAWAAATFAGLAAAVLMGSATEAVWGDDVPLTISKVTILLLVAFPYLLFRFGASFGHVGRGARRLAAAAVAGLAVFTLALPELPAADESRAALFNGYVAAVLTVWVALSVSVARRLWRAGTGQPTLARRRMRLLGAAAVVLSLALVFAATGGGDEATGTALAVQLLALFAAVLFGVAFAPPGLLRIAWRQPEERELHDASLRLMGATTAAQVTELLLPHVAAVTGARVVTMHDETGQVVASGGSVPDDAADPDERGEAVEVPLSSGRLRVRVSRYTPFFGNEELVILQRLGLVADLALDRTTLLASERQARTELEVANRELESFVYSASHDLKSPLIATLGYLEVLRSEYTDALGEDGNWYVERMLANGRYMESLIQDLLELSRVGRMQVEPERVDLDRVVSELVEEQRARNPHLRIETEPLPTLWINPLRVQQLLTNLLENAADHGARPDLTVRVSCAPLDDGGVLLCVDDDGRGIPAEYRAQVFEVFERLTGEDGGTGVGLAICRKIVDSVGGDIWVADEEPGAHFRIRLPADAVVAARPEVGSPPPPQTNEVRA